jgi:hypothetical protein
VVSSSSAATDRLVHHLGTSFALKDLGPLHYFLSIEVHTPSRGGLLLSQQKYVSKLLLKAGLQKCALVTTPMVASETLSANDGTPLSAEESTSYSSIVGSLQYLTMTRPDLSFASIRCVNTCMLLGVLIGRHSNSSICEGYSITWSPDASLLYHATPLCLL